MTLHDPWDTTGDAVKVERPLLERDVQSKCVVYARSKGFLARKFSSPSQRSVPDYIFSKKWATGLNIKWMEEFKAPKKTPTDAQEDEHKEHREAGWLVMPDTGRYGWDDINAFKARINLMEEIGNGVVKANWPI